MHPPRPSQNVAFATAALLILLLAANRIWLIPAHVSTDSNEGWNAFQAVRALGGDPLYPPPGALTTNNYPPLSFYLIGWLGRWVGDAIVAGRIVAAFALLVVAAEVRALVRRFAGAGPAANAAALLFLGFAVTLFRTYLCIDDPQWLAHALMTAALLLIVPPRPGDAPGTGAVVLAALLTVAGGLVKHNLLALPFAATLWLALHHRRAFLIWAATGVSAVLLTALLCHHLYGPAFFADVLSTDRREDTVRMITKSAPILAAFLPLLILWAGLIAERKADRRIDLLLILVPVALCVGVIQRAGLGVDRNAHFETLVALAVSAGVMLARGWREGGRPARPALRLLLLPFVVLVPFGLAGEAHELREESRVAADWQLITRQIRAVPGRVACETQALCYWAGKDFEIDFFLYGERMAAGRGASALQQALGARRFAGVEVERPRVTREPANPVWPLVERAYRTRFAGPDGRRLLVPR